MDPKVVQALMQTLQQALQILQSASAAPSGEPDGDEDEEMQGADASMGDDMGDEDGDEDGNEMDDADASMDDDMGDEDDDDSLDKDMDETMPTPKKPGKMMGGGGSSLHDRISALESHTGLKKSASNLPLVQRVDALEDYHLGEQYEGSVLERVGQLEGVVLGKSASDDDDDEAPEEIALDDLIKAAVAEGSKKAVHLALSELGLTKSAGRSRELPNLQTMRKAAKTGNPTYGRRRSQAIEMTDAQLQKSAQRWGMDGEDLDEPLTLGDSLQALFNAGRGSGGTLGEFMEADDD